MLPQIVRSIFPEPHSDASPRRFLLKTLILHFRPATVPRKTLRFSLTWGLGGMAATLILLQLATGVLLKFSYVPTPVAAYDSVSRIMIGIPFGGLIRNLHYWCSHLLVAVVILHVLRVFFTGAFHPPRQFNWVVGLGLIGMVLTANFTGYLLPWDQLAYWAVTVSIGMLDYVPFIGAHLQELIRDGGDVGAGTLQLFSAMHTAVIPIALVGLMLFHFWRVRKAGGVVAPRRPGDPPEVRPERVPSVPGLLLREVVVALVLVAGVMVLAAFVDAPLGDPANSGLSPNPTRAPWYFAGLQELLLHIHPAVAVCIIPVILGGALLILPYIRYPVDSGGIWWVSRTGRTTAAIAAAAGVVLPVLLVLLDGRLGSTATANKSLPPIVAKGLLPTLLLGGVVPLFHLILRRGFAVNRNEAVQALFILLITAYGGLTLIAVWFRGAEMALVLPW